MIKKIVTPLLTYLCAFSLLAPQTSFCAATTTDQPVPVAQTTASDGFELSEKAKMLLLILGGGTIVSLGESINAYRKAKKRGTLPHKINSYWGFLKKRFHNAVFKPQDTFKTQPVFSSALYLSSFLLVSKALEATREAVEKDTGSRLTPEQQEIIRTNNPAQFEALQRAKKKPFNPLSQEYIEVVESIPTRPASTTSFNSDTYLQAFAARPESTVVRDAILGTLLLEQQLRAEGKTPKQQFLCLAGVPGVGKTTITEFIARGLGRPLQVVAVGGEPNSSTITGHARSFQEAQVGAIVQAFIDSKCTNPVILIDEIDKLCASANGNPSAVLLRLFDPAQNREFKDHFLGFPVDLSQVMFVATANDINLIPPALRDRLKIITVPPYTVEQKIQIAHRFTMTNSFRAFIQAEEGQNSAFITALIQALDNVESGVRKAEDLITSANEIFTTWRPTRPDDTLDTFQQYCIQALTARQQAAQQQP